MLDVILLILAGLFLVVGIINGLLGEYSKGAFYMAFAAVEILLAVL